MLVNSKTILTEAKKEGYGIPAPDYLDLDSARVFVKTAEKLNKPLILSYPQLLNEDFPLIEAAYIGKLLGESTEIQVALHLDHGTDFEFIKKAIDLGFTSVMIDASMKSFEENVRITKQVVEYAHPRQVTVEAEIGHVGYNEDSAETGKSDNIFTSVEEAVKFVEMTKVDSLAVSIGTLHGTYKNAKKPNLNFERLRDISKAVSVPLVLHGGSGSGDENLKKSVHEGITKVNIFTDFLSAAMIEIDNKKPNNYIELKKCVNLSMGDILEHYYNLLT